MNTGMEVDNCMTVSSLTHFHLMRTHMNQTDVEMMVVQA
jgi:hypothetical protein